MAVRDVIELLIPIFIILVGGMVFFVVLFMGIDYATCKGFGAATETSVRYSFGCYVEVDGKFVPREYVYGNAHELRHK
jgi:hypothetical protein